MLLCFLLTSWTLSIMFMTLNHPLSMGGILLAQTILMALTTGFFFLNFWFSYILFLIMIGGMLVMFIYMTSIASNEKFSMPKKSLLFMATSSSLGLLIMIFLDYFFPLQLNLHSSMNSFNTQISNLCMNKYFNYPGMFMLICLMIYLLITLIAIVKITGKSKGTLRQK
uniref:NADH-ubiquinone oxidoreductase chain 6 n=1 Tax=Trigonopterus triradiatus TaxID=2678947 RepID=A0A7H1KHX6_9CUCU|nr:NADH dehydrogenase subunit 6 [Trigonopterus triradiatus]QNT26892.1 NADH dehydrogenase subunit 6 [Trigonopterus triradiatus]